MSVFFASLLLALLQQELSLQIKLLLVSSTVNYSIDFS